LSVIAVDARARGGGNVSVVSGVGPREDSDVVGVAGGWGGGGGGGSYVGPGGRGGFVATADSKMLLKRDTMARG